ncbi:MAG: hypothetical protein AAF228_04700 [Pseudomonadota bacterium]
MAIFSSEAEMQNWLSNKLREVNDFYSLILNKEYLKTFRPKSYQERKFLESYNMCSNSFYLFEIIAENENISLSPKEGLKPDFLCYCPETQSIAIVELKNLSGSTRQAGTQISAYTNEVRSYLPFISDGDIINIIISTCWPTLLCHYISHEVLWMQRHVMCLEPVKDGENIALKIVDIKTILSNNSAIQIGEKHVGGYHMCLYPKEPHDDPGILRENITQMKSAVSAMAIKGNSHKGHGFALLWQNLADHTSSPYVITMVSSAPFQGLDRFYHASREGTHLVDTQYKFMNLLVEYDPEGASQSLEEIYNYGANFLKSICSPQPENFTTWDNLKLTMGYRIEAISFVGWGIFGEYFYDVLQQRYNSGYSTTLNDCPSVGYEVIGKLIDPKYSYVDHVFLRELIEQKNEFL